MNKMKKVFKVAIYELKLMCFSSKFLILSVLAFIIMDVTVRGYRMFSHDYNLPIAPAVLPFYFADVSYGNIEILFLLLWCFWCLIVISCCVITVLSNKVFHCAQSYAKSIFNGVFF